MMDMEVRDEIRFLFISNIPESYDVFALRCFFSNAVEDQVFSCFHFLKRRHDQAVDQDEGSQQKKSKKAFCTIVSLKHCKVPLILKDYDGKPWTCPNTGELLQPTQRCSVQIYSGQTFNSADSDAASMNSLEYPTRQEVFDTRSAGLISSMAIGFWKKYNETISLTQQKQIAEKAHQFRELHPPPLLPRGNVGTATRTLQDLVAQCKLPTSALRALRPVFRHRRNLRRCYGEVPLDYAPAAAAASPGGGGGSGGGGGEEGGGPGRKRPRPGGGGGGGGGGGARGGAGEGRPRAGPDPRGAPFLRARGLAPGDDDGAEIWDVPPEFEVPTVNQTHTENRMEYLYEEPRSVSNPWDKGDASGLVLYTDALHWERLRGPPEDHYGGDSFGVGGDPHSSLEDPNAGPSVAPAGERGGSDAPTPERGAGADGSWSSSPSSDGNDEEKQQNKLNRKQRRAKNKVELHTPKVPFAQQMMLKMGWQPGKGIGKYHQGLRQPLEAESRTFQEGLGYQPESTHLIKKKRQTKRRHAKHIIASVFDGRGCGGDDEGSPPRPLLLLSEAAGGAATQRVAEGVFRLLPKEERKALPVCFVQAEEDIDCRWEEG